MIQTANESLRDDAIAQAHLIERLKTGEVHRIIAFLNRDLYPALLEEIERRLANIATRGFDTGVWTTQRLQALKTAYEDIIATQMGLARDEFTDRMVDFADHQAEWQAARVADASPIDLGFTLPSTSMLRSVVLARPFQGRLLRDWFDDLESSTAQKVTQAINIGIAQGDPSAKIVQRLRGTRANGYSDGILDQSRRNVEGVVRTAVAHVSSHAREATYEANSDVIQGVQWVSTLDTQTTLICISLDGKVFPIGEGPRPPAHFGCRSTTIPLLKSWKDLGIKLKEPPVGTRAAMDGQVPANQTYGEWLRNQSVARQNAALGPRRAELWRNSEIQIDQFVSSHLEPLTLEELMSN